MSQDDKRKAPNQGEGDRESARRYDKDARDFVATGKVPDAAADAKRYVEKSPGDARRAERQAKRGPKSSWSSIDSMVASGASLIERARRAAASLRTRLGKK